MTPVSQPHGAIWKIAVAIPVKNEAEHVAACLEALSDQREPNGDVVPPFDVVLFVNNSDDRTAAIASDLSDRLSFRLTIVQAVLPPEEASAGGARRHAMEAAARLLEQSDGSGLLLTTDADSRVPQDWIVNTVAAIDAGADAVAGTLALDPDDEAALPASLKARGALEGRYEALVCELETRLDPRPYDPWPRHPTESGASFALTLASFRAVGGVPHKALGEDRALAEALFRGGFRVRHAPDVKVITSGRLVGRAEGGCADTMRYRIAQPDARCDEYLRPALDILRERGRREGASRPEALQSRRLGPEELPTQILIVRAILMALKARVSINHRAVQMAKSILAALRGPGTLIVSSATTAPEQETENAAPT